ncbi:MAG: di-trans,poly-cis-decaprenylcistransferase [Pelagibacteraceae bacterium]|nr:MAG: di-trans,poly-cis-decaprenylcistransferase [Pelagibacteraceae bacterium]
MNSINHVAIIMDGNGRWGLEHFKSRNRGHKEGIKTIEKIIKESIKHNIKFLTLYAFSTENWKRPKKEINYLFSLLEYFLKKKINDFIKENIKLKIIGKKFLFRNIFKIINFCENKTKNNTKLQINLALNYGSKSEIIDAIKLLNKNKIQITEKKISENLYTKNIPDPEILIRTGNTHRLSNFLLWQLSYTEIFFVKKLWPDFNEKDFTKIVNTFRYSKRNYGKI